MKHVPSWISTAGIIALILAASALIAFVPGMNVWFLCFYALIFVLCCAGAKYFSAAGVVTVRMMVGAVFVFSSFSKGVDPIGTAYQIQDYLEAYRLPWLAFLSVFGSFLLNLVEFCVGIFLIFNIHLKYTVWVLTAMMVFFTGVTVYDAVAEPVPDCGCFGKALVLTNWQTFYKNLSLDAGVILLLAASGRTRTHSKGLYTWLVMGFAAVLFTAFESYNYRYLPVLNFLEWKKGERLFPENPLPKQYYVTYQNLATGENREYLLSECPFNEPGWKEQWKFVDSRVVDPNPAPVNINIMERYGDEDEGTDITQTLLESPDNYLFLTAVYSVKKSSHKGMEKTAAFLRRMREKGHDVCLLTASSYAESQEFLKKYNLEGTPVYFADDKAVEAVIRSNPGVVLVRNGYVMELWDWRRLPADWWPMVQLKK